MLNQFLKQYCYRKYHSQKSFTNSEKKKTISFLGCSRGYNFKYRAYSDWEAWNILWKLLIGESSRADLYFLLFLKRFLTLNLSAIVTWKESGQIIHFIWKALASVGTFGFLLELSVFRSFQFSVLSVNFGRNRKDRKYFQTWWKVHKVPRGDWNIWKDQNW